MTSFSTQFMHPTRSRQGPTVWATSATPKRPGKKQNALVTMSGGQDSGLVSWVLFHTQDYYPCQLKSLHYQHLLQPDALYAQKHCSQLSFWFNWKSLYYSATRYYTSEKDAGDWRSKSSFRLASYYSYPFLLKVRALPINTKQGLLYFYAQSSRRKHPRIFRYPRKTVQSGTLIDFLFDQKS